MSEFLALRNCSPCPTVEMVRELRAAGFIGNPDRPFTWDDWDDEYNDLVPNGKDRTPAQVMLSWLIYLSKTPYGGRYLIWLYGETGIGKTHLACITAVWWAIGMGVTPVYSNWSIRLGAIKDSFSNGYAGAQRLDMEEHAGILVLDDLGAERVTLFNLEALYRIAESRRGRPTIVTSNQCVSDYCKRIHHSDRLDDEKYAVLALADKIEDRLQTGAGGYLLWEIPIKAKESYRRKP